MWKCGTAAARSSHCLLLLSPSLPHCPPPPPSIVIGAFTGRISQSFLQLNMVLLPDQRDANRSNMFNFQAVLLEGRSGLFLSLFSPWAGKHAGHLQLCE